MTIGEPTSILVVTDSDARRDMASRALQDIGEVVFAPDVAGALEELSLDHELVTVVDTELPGNDTVDILGAVGDPSRVVLWVPDLHSELFQYGGLIQIPHDANAQILAEAVARTVNELRLKAEVERQRRQVERLEHAVEVVRDIRHEINNPLTSMLAEAQLLLMDAEQFSDDHQQAIKAIEQGARRVRDLVKKLQNLRVGGE